MAYERREFAGGAVGTTITGSINSGATEIILADATGWPTGSVGKFFVVLGRGTASEEKVRATGRVGTTVTLDQRGSDGTTATSHTLGETAEHVFTALDADEANAHVANEQADPHPMYLTSAEAAAAYQPVDSDLTAIAALTTTSYGRAFLALADAAAARTATGAAPSATFPVVFCIAMSDETTALTTGTAKAVFHPPYAFTLTGVYAEVSTVSSSGLVTVDVNEGAGAGTSVLSTKLSIDANEETSATAATAAVISDSAIAANARLTFDIDAAGTGAKGLKCWLIGTRSL